MSASGQPSRSSVTQTWRSACSTALLAMTHSSLVEALRHPPHHAVVFFSLFGAPLPVSGDDIPLRANFAPQSGNEKCLGCVAQLNPQSDSLFRRQMFARQ